MGRSQEKDRKRRQAAATCQRRRLDGFLFPKTARDQLVTPDPDFTQPVAEDDQVTPTSSECCSVNRVERVGSSSTATYVEPLRSTCCEVHDNEAQRVDCKRRSRKSAMPSC